MFDILPEINDPAEGGDTRAGPKLVVNEIFGPTLGCAGRRAEHGTHLRFSPSRRM
jgi:hypothetical protein